MADTVTAPDNDLYNKVMDLNRRRLDDWRRFALATPAGGIAGALRGPGAGAQVAGQFYNHPAPYAAAADIAAKSKIIDSMMDYAKTSGADRLNLAAKLDKRADILKALLDASTGAFGVYGQGLTRANQTVDEALTKMHGDLGDVVMKAIEKASPSSGPEVMRAFDNIRQAMSGVEGSNGPAAMAAIRDEFSKLYMTDKPGAQALVMMLEASAPQFDLENFNGFMKSAADAGDPAARDAYGLMQKIGSMPDTNLTSAIDLVMADKLSTIANLKTGSPSMDAWLKNAVAAVNTFRGEMDPDQIGKLVDGALKAGGQNPQQPMDAAQRLLEQIDSDNLPPASSLGEARKRVLEDPKFQQWMHENGLTDPGLALKEMRRLVSEQNHAQKQQTRTALRERRMGGVNAESGPPVGSLGAQLANQNGPTKPANDDPTFVWDNEGHLWFYGEDGALRRATDEDVEQHLKPAEESEDPEAALAALIKPSSDYDGIKEAAEKLSKEATDRLAVQAKAEQAAPDFKSAGQTPGQVAGNVTYGLAHPGATLRQGENLVNGLLDKRKRARMKVRGLFDAPAPPPGDGSNDDAIGIG